LTVEGEENLTVYRASSSDSTNEQERYKSERKFCKHCSAMLLLNIKAYPDIVFPFASAIDTKLLDPAKLDKPQPLTIMFSDDKLPWAHLPEGEKKLFKTYPDKNFQEWMENAGLSM